MSEAPATLTSTSSSLRSESTASNINGVDNNNLESHLPIEFRIQGEGSDGDKEMPQIMLQPRLLGSTGDIVAPRFPFLPTFTNLQQPLPQTQETTTTTATTITTSKGKAAKKLSCSICLEDFPSRALLKQHKATHEYEMYPCDSCSKAFSKKTALKRHLLSHTTDRPHVCEHCGKGLFLYCPYCTD